MNDHVLKNLEENKYIYTNNKIQGLDHPAPAQVTKQGTNLFRYVSTTTTTTTFICIPFSDCSKPNSVPNDVNPLFKILLFKRLNI